MRQNRIKDGNTLGWRKELNTCRGKRGVLRCSGIIRKAEEDCGQWNTRRRILVTCAQPLIVNNLHWVRVGSYLSRRCEPSRHKIGDMNGPGKLPKESKGRGGMEINIVRPACAGAAHKRLPSTRILPGSEATPWLFGSGQWETFFRTDLGSSGTLKTVAFILTRSRLRKWT